MKDKLRIVFFGTPSFAAEILETIIEHGFSVIYVVTSPDKPAGRGLSIRESEVKKMALRHSLPLLQPHSLQDPAFTDELRRVQPDIFIVVAFRMLPEKVWSIPPMGTFNIHASLLPSYRGAAPIQHALLNGEKETGVTFFKINQTIDAGEIVSQQRVEIMPEDNFGTLHEKLLNASKKLIMEELTFIQSRGMEELQRRLTKQDEKKISLAPKISRKDFIIDWKDSSLNIHNKIRAFSPSPGAECFWKKNENKKIRIKIFNSCIRLDHIWEEEALPGEAKIINKEELIVKTGSREALQILELQAEGKKRMSAADFLRGYPNLKKWIFE